MANFDQLATQFNKAIAKLNLLDDFGDIQHVSLPEFWPDQATMDRFDADPMALWRACNAWWEMLLHPPAGLEDPHYEFDQLTQALQLWASMHGLGDGMVLADAATAWYRHETSGDAVIRAEAFVSLIKNRGLQSRIMPATAPLPPEPKPILMNVEQASEMLTISTRKLHGLTKAGSVPSVRVGKLVRYTEESLRRWIAENERRGGRKGIRKRMVQNHAILCNVERHFGVT